jgi:hypothetical protein
VAVFEKQLTGSIHTTQSPGRNENVFPPDKTELKKRYAVNGTHNYINFVADIYNIRIY